MNSITDWYKLYAIARLHDGFLEVGRAQWIVVVTVQDVARVQSNHSGPCAPADLAHQRVNLASILSTRLQRPPRLYPHNTYRWPGHTELLASLAFRHASSRSPWILHENHHALCSSKLDRAQISAHLAQHDRTRQRKLYEAHRPTRALVSGCTHPRQRDERGASSKAVAPGMCDHRCYADGRQQILSAFCKKWSCRRC